MLLITVELTLATASASIHVQWNDFKKKLINTWNGHFVIRLKN